MTLIDDLEGLVAERRKCVVAKWVSTLDPSEQAQIDEVFRSRHRVVDIREVLKRRYGELPFSLDSLQCHLVFMRGNGKDTCPCRI